MYNTLNKQTSSFVALSLILVLFSTCKKDNCECNTANVPTIEWQKTIGDSDEVFVKNVQKTTDGGYILAGYKYTSQNGGDYWIVKLNSNADIEWEKTYGGNSFDVANNIQQTIDGGYIVAGYTNSNDGDVTNNNGSTDAWILKLNANGNIEWQKTYGGSNSDDLTSIKQTADGGYIAVGSTASNDGDILNNQGYTDVWIIKIANNGNLQWSKTFGGTNGEIANDVQQITNGEYLIVAYTFSNNGDITNNHGSFDAWVIKINSNGNMLWQRTYGGHNFDNFNVVEKIKDGNYVLVGNSSSNDGDLTNNQGLSDTWVMKIDNSSNILWQKNIGIINYETANNVLETNDSNLLLSCSYQINILEDESVLLIRLNSNGSILWQLQIPQENGNSSANSIFETPDCGYIVFGNKNVQNGIKNALIIKLK